MNSLVEVIQKSIETQYHFLGQEDRLLPLRFVQN